MMGRADIRIKAINVGVGVMTKNMLKISHGEFQKIN